MHSESKNQNTKRRMEIKNVAYFIFELKNPRMLILPFFNFMAPFYGWGSTVSRLEPLWGGSLLFTTKFPEIPGTPFIGLRRMRGWVDLGATQ